MCAGHFLEPKEALQVNAMSTMAQAQPPSTILKEFFQKLHSKEPSQDQIQSIAEKTLLSVSEFLMWLEHLKTVDVNRKRGAVKAAETRRKKRESQQVQEMVYYCGICAAAYGESDDSG